MLFEINDAFVFIKSKYNLREKPQRLSAPNKIFTKFLQILKLTLSIFRKVLRPKILGIL